MGEETQNPEIASNFNSQVNPTERVISRYKQELWNFYQQEFLPVMEKHGIASENNLNSSDLNQDNFIADLRITINQLHESYTERLENGDFDFAEQEELFLVFRDMESTLSRIDTTIAAFRALEKSLEDNMTECFLDHVIPVLRKHDIDYSFDKYQETIARNAGLNFSIDVTYSIFRNMALTARLAAGQAYKNEMLDEAAITEIQSAFEDMDRNLKKAQSYIENPYGHMMEKLNKPDTDSSSNVVARSSATLDKSNISPFS